VAYPQPDAAQASQRPVGIRTPWRVLGRLVLATVAAALLVGIAGLPTTAAWPVASRDSYLSRGYSSSHRADDIAVARGTRIVPVGSGRVVFAGWRSNCGGYQVWVSHGDGRYTAYYHMGREVVYAGKPVTRQETTLGYVGSSGCATGAHVHVELWKGYPWRSGSYRVNPWGAIDSGVYLPYRYR
jgi:murein DD-endopeptidase MepM/ murein hydrolase activator NlpD